MVSRKVVLTVAFAVFLFAPLAIRGEEVTSGLAEVNGTKLYYEMAGQGHPVVLIHGGVLSSSEWDEQFIPFAEHYQVIRYDVRGCGKSETRKLPYSNSEDLYQLLRFLRIEKTVVIGGSMGGGIAVDFALEHPDMVDALVMVGGVVSGWQYSPEFMQRGLKILMAAAEEGPEKGADLWLADPYLIPAPENPAARQKFRKLFIEKMTYTYNEKG
jgi:pimeloyl-ACP methyl ester carboxylesterase